MAKKLKSYEPDMATDNETETNVGEIRDVDLSVIAKQKFRLDGDNERIIELNTSDLGIIGRIEGAEEKLKALAEKVQSLEIQPVSEDTDLEDVDMSEFATQFDEIDKEMRNLIDYIFDSPVADKAGNCGTMYDPINGKFRYEYIIDRLIGLYENDLRREATAISHKARMRASKYTG